jgi:hypothetical protein
MALASYPNITINSTTFTLKSHTNGAIITSTYGSSVNVVVSNDLPAGHSCWIIQMGAGAVWVTAGSGATLNSTGTGVATAALYSAVKLMAVTDGNFVLTGSLA